MGYYTKFEIEVDPGRENIIIMKDTLVCGDYTLDAFMSHDVIEMKWYDHDDDMRNFSRLFPTAVITLTGFGEESKDIWRSYYSDGKCHEAKTEIVYEKFDKEKLK